MLHPSHTAAVDTTRTEEGNEEIEGVFVVDGGRAHFRTVEVGISSQKHFEVITGLEVGDKVVVVGWPKTPKSATELVVTSDGRSFGVPQ